MIHGREKNYLLRGWLSKKQTLELVGGFNPSEKYESNWKPSPNTCRGLEKNIFMWLLSSLLLLQQHVLWLLFGTLGVHMPHGSMWERETPATTLLCMLLWILEMRVLICQTSCLVLMSRSNQTSVFNLSELGWGSRVKTCQDQFISYHSTRLAGQQQNYPPPTPIVWETQLLLHQTMSCLLSNSFCLLPLLRIRRLN